MSRFWLMLALGTTLAAQDKPPAQKPPPQQQKEELPPEEDEAAKEQQFSFNPLKSKKDIDAGDTYLKSRKNPRAAAERYRWATRWNPGNATAWLKLAETDERPDVGNKEEAKQAYEKYLELAPDAKNVGEVRKKLARL